jgi:hypothetical protein
VVGTEASSLLIDGRDVAIQMTAVAATMAAREVRRGMVGIIGQTRPDDADRDEEGM